ncbi:MAG: (2Fe-2S) ferredoxin domain-containing protein [Nanoarchaeota archaeon]|nr:(2Fe-2S) ferredoxin domain-containing protein [Nanoarchaeota archaeon]
MVLEKKDTNIPKPQIHLLICINSRTNSDMPHCSLNFTIDDFKKFKQWIIEEKLLLKVKITATRCLGLCSKDKSICLLYPKQEYYLFNTIEDLKELIYKNLKT